MMIILDTGILCSNNKIKTNNVHLYLFLKDDTMNTKGMKMINNVACQGLTEEIHLVTPHSKQSEKLLAVRGQYAPVSLEC